MRDRLPDHTEREFEKTVVLEQLVRVLEESEARMEAGLQEKSARRLRNRIPSLDYLSEFAYKFFAQINPDLRGLLDADPYTRTVSKRRLHKLCRKEKPIKDVLAHIEKECISYFKQGKQHFVHADPNIRNFRSVEGEFQLGDWERTFVDAKPQYSLWILLATAFPDVHTRAAVQESFLEQAFRDRYNIRRIDDLQSGRLQEFKEGYERMDLYQSILHVVRQLRRYTQATEEATEEESPKAEAYATSARDIFQYVQELLTRLALPCMKTDLEECIRYTFPPDAVRLLELDTEQTYVTELGKEVAKKPFEIAAEKRRNKRQWFKKHRRFAAAVGGLAATVTAAFLGFHGMNKEQAELPQQLGYQKGFSSARYTYNEKAPFSVEDILLDSKPLRFDDRQRMIAGKKYVLSMPLKKDQKKFPDTHVFEATLVSDDTRIPLSRTYLRPFATKEGVHLAMDVTVPVRAASDTRNYSLEVRLRSFSETNFKAVFPVHVVNPLGAAAHQNAVRRVYDALTVEDLGVHPTNPREGDVVFFSPKLHVANPKNSPLLRQKPRIVYLLNDGSVFEAPLIREEERTRDRAVRAMGEAVLGERILSEKQQEAVLQDLLGEGDVIAYKYHLLHPLAISPERLFTDDEVLDVRVYLRMGSLSPLWLGTEHIVPEGYVPSSDSKVLGIESVCGAACEPGCKPMERKFTVTARGVSQLTVHEVPRFFCKINPSFQYASVAVAFECAVQSPTVVPQLTQVYYRAHIPVLDVFSEPVSGKGAVVKGTITIPLSDSVKDGLYQVIVEEESRMNTGFHSFGQAGFSYVYVGKRYADAWDEFVRRAAERPEQVMCFYEPFDPVHAPRAEDMQACMRLLRGIEQEDEFKKYRSGTPFDFTYQIAERPKQLDLLSGSVTLSLQRCSEEPMAEALSVSADLSSSRTIKKLGVRQIGDQYVLIVCGDKDGWYDPAVVQERLDNLLSDRADGGR